MARTCDYVRTLPTSSGGFWTAPLSLRVGFIEPHVGGLTQRIPLQRQLHAACKGKSLRGLSPTIVAHIDRKNGQFSGLTRTDWWGFPVARGEKGMPWRVHQRKQSGTRWVDAGGEKAV